MSNISSSCRYTCSARCYLIILYTNLLLLCFAVALAMAADVVLEIEITTTSADHSQRQNPPSALKFFGTVNTRNDIIEKRNEDNSSSASSSSSEDNKFYDNLNVLTIARSLSSESFLRKLVSAKNTKDEKYFMNENDNSVSCEYIGSLWFMSRKKGIDFRESVRVIDQDRQNVVGGDGSYSSSSIECHSQYRNGNGEWIDCAKVNCLLRPSDDNRNVTIEITSELLVDVWMPSKLTKVVRNKISRTFEEATLAFLSR